MPARQASELKGGQRKQESECEESEHKRMYGSMPKPERARTQASVGETDGEGGSTNFSDCV